MSIEDKLMKISAFDEIHFVRRIAKINMQLIDRFSDMLKNELKVMLYEKLWPEKIATKLAKLAKLPARIRKEPRFMQLVTV